MSRKNTHLTLLISFLFITGVSIFLYRHFTLGVPLTAEATINSWMVEANLRFEPQPNTPIKASFIIPNMPPFYATLDEYFVHHNYGVRTNITDNNRETVWSKRRAKGLQSLYYRAIFKPTQSDDLPLAAPGTLIKKELKDSEHSAVEAITTEARKTSADIQTFAQETIKQLHSNKGNSKSLIGNDTSNASLVNAAILILNQANIQAMPIQIIHVSAQNRAKPVTYLAVFDEKSWVIIDPISSSAGLPKNQLIWQYGDSPLYQVIGGNKEQFNISVSPTPVSALSIAKIRGTQTESQLIKFSLLQLPLDVQETYKVLLTVPIGAFVILLLRNFVGLVTFGTFMPVLVALAFRQTHIIWGITLFSTLVSFGLLVRFYLDELRLLLVPRLATILTVVILLMIAISIFCQHLGIQKGLSVALFPMVILTMVIERMCITWDERGSAEALKAGLGSLIAASITYGVMSNKELEYLVFAFPELLLVLMGFILWFGQYRGYRLLELIRFKAMSKIDDA